jgi:hypothetical protein
MNKPLKGLDQQGRYPEAAEAATDIGQDEPDFYGREFLLEELGALVVWGIGIVALIGLVGFLIGRFV